MLAQLPMNLPDSNQESEISSASSSIKVLFLSIVQSCCGRYSSIVHSFVGCLSKTKRFAYLPLSAFTSIIHSHQASHMNPHKASQMKSHLVAIRCFSSSYSRSAHVLVEMIQGGLVSFNNILYYTFGSAFQLSTCRQDSKSNLKFET